MKLFCFAWKCYNFDACPGSKLSYRPLYTISLDFALCSWALRGCAPVEFGNFATFNDRP